MGAGSRGRVLMGLDILSSKRCVNKDLNKVAVHKID